MKKRGWLIRSALFSLGLVLAPALVGVAPALAQTLTVSPPGGGTVAAGTTQTIQWTTTGDVGATVSIDLYKGGAFWTSIVASTPNDGEYSWSIAQDEVPGTDYAIHVEGPVPGPPVATDDSVVFTITAYEPTITSPQGGEVWGLGTAQEITWQKEDFPTSTMVDIVLVDGPLLAPVTIIEDIASNVPNTGSFPWSVPLELPAGTEYRIMVVPSGGLDPVVFSDNYFTLSAGGGGGGAADPDQLLILNPFKGMIVTSGSAQKIIWTTTGNPGPAVSLELYKGGFPIPAAEGGPLVIAASTPNSGSFDWNVAVGQMPGTDYAISIQSTSTPVSNISGQFTIAPYVPIVTSPPAGSVNYLGDDCPIAWVSGFFANSTRVTITLSGPTPLTIVENVPNTGVFPWKIPKDLSPGETYRITITGANDICAEALCKKDLPASTDNFFSIQPMPDPPSAGDIIAVLRPGGGALVTAGHRQAIVWTTTGNPGPNVRIELYKAGAVIPAAGGGPIVLADPTPNDGLFEWDVPLDLIPGTDYSIHVESTSTAAEATGGQFTVGPYLPTVTSPMGNEVWWGGTEHLILWMQDDFPGSARVTITLTGPSALTIAEDVPNTGSFPWIVPSNLISAATYKVTITPDGVSDLPASSPNYFSIMQNALRVLSPNGGETWTAGTEHDVTWSNEGSVAGDLRIDLYKGDLLNSNVVLSTPVAGGAYTWTIPVEQEPGEDYKIRITSVDDSGLYAVSFSQFSIASSAPSEIVLNNTSVLESAAVGTKVGTLSTIDADPGDAFTYALVDGTGSADNDTFDIPVGSNELQTAVPFDSAVQSSFSIRVRSTDLAGAWVEKAFTITLRDENARPTALALSGTVVEENAGASTLVGSFTTTDPDAGDAFTYALIAGGPDNASFAVTGSDLVTAAVFNYELKRTYNIRVRTTDQGGLFFDQAFAISVTDVGEFLVTSPFGGESWKANSLHTITWAKDGGTHGAFVRIDLYRGGLLNRWISASTDNDGSFDWSIPGNQPQGTTYKVRITSTANPTVFSESFGEFSIVLPDTSIGLTGDSVFTGSASGTVVGTLGVVPDTGEVCTFDRVSGDGDTDNASFTIVGSELRTARFMGLVEDLAVRIGATCPTQVPAAKSFTIHVVNPPEVPAAPVDMNLNPRAVVQGRPASTKVGTFTTVDLNADDTHTYTLVGGGAPCPGTDNALFSVAGDDLVTAAPLLIGAYAICARSTDPAALFREEPFTITVGANFAPVLAAIGDRTVSAGATLDIVMEATDANAGDVPVCSVEDLPAGADFDAANCEFTWQPSSADVGDYDVTFRVTDASGATDFEIVHITVFPWSFLDDFSDGNAAGDPDWVKISGAWSVNAAKRYVAKSTTKTNISLADQAAVAAGRIEALVKMNDLGGSTAPNAMIIFSYQSPNQYRFVKLVKGGIRIGQVEPFGGSNGKLVSSIVSARTGRFYTLTLDLYDDGDARVYLDGIPAGFYSFPTARAGMVGVGSTRNGAAFDDFAIFDPGILP